jgi:hypothetical protein
MKLEEALPEEYVEALAAFLAGYRNQSSSPSGRVVVAYDPPVTLAEGLSEDELVRAEAAFGCHLPPDLRSLLTRVVFTGNPWPSWREPERLRTAVMDYVVQIADFDIRNNDYWNEAWGVRPQDLKAAGETAAQFLQAAPPLLPLLGHRFLPALPERAGNPVLSVGQFVDTINYGNDLADYFNRELGAPRQSWAAKAPKGVPFWSSVAEVIPPSQA